MTKVMGYRRNYRHSQGILRITSIEATEMLGLL
jgi:hypothetical protein